MENAAEALKMAAFVLIFVMALTISINAFGEVRQASQAILDNQDREYDYTYVEENKDASGKSVTDRIVNAETIVPSIYKAYKENYKIVFQFHDSSLSQGLYQKAKENSLTERIPVFSIDLEEDVLGNDTQKEEFIHALLYGTKYTNEINEFKKSGIFLNGKDFYDIIVGKTFTEKLGVYYQEELQGKTDTPQANKTKKRVITYIEN